MKLLVRENARLALTIASGYTGPQIAEQMKRDDWFNTQQKLAQYKP